MSGIQYYSTNLKAKKVTFREALLKGQAPDKGLYMPEKIPLLTEKEIADFSHMKYHEIAFVVAGKFLGDQISENDLREITRDAYNFDVPLENVFEKKYLMRLDQGPTASFKDFAARMMGRLMQYFLRKEDKKLLILAATSGDTGSAIANAFYELENIKVVVLFPKDEVTDRQRKQMTTLHKNIQVLALDGKFDDCQAMVKKAFADKDLHYLELSSANSINIGRLIPQSIYYIYAYSHLCNIHRNEEIIFSVPSGNFGNLMGGLIAHEMGLPVKRFIVCTNENNEVPIFFETEKYKIIEPSINCISSAMNVGHPSNMARVIALYGGVMNEKGEIEKLPDMNKLHNDMYAISIDDDDTREEIINMFRQYRIIIEPHGAVGWKGLKKYLRMHPFDDNPDQVFVTLETAHPSKFSKEIKELLKKDPVLSPGLKGLDGKKEEYINFPDNYDKFKEFLTGNYT